MLNNGTKEQRNKGTKEQRNKGTKEQKKNIEDILQDKFDVWSDINSPNNHSDIDTWADVRNPNNEDYLDDD